MHDHDGYTPFSGPASYWLGMFVGLLKWAAAAAAVVGLMMVLA